MATSVTKAAKGTRRTRSRPKRGLPAETRSRIVEAAANEFRTQGYFGTDSNVIAHAAGYAAGTFYKHFDSKRTVFLAVYVEWVSAQWADIAKLVQSDLPDRQVATQVIDSVLAHHRVWRVFRASLRALLATDAVVRRYNRTLRRRQLQVMRELLSGADDPRDAINMLITERIADALADGEADAINLSREVARDFLISELVLMFKRRRRRSVS